MNENSIGVKSIGIKCPIIREGDNLVDIVYDSVVKSGITLQDKDVIGITESIVARAYGNYATIDEIGQSVRALFKDQAERLHAIHLISPIYSRNRFAMILRGIARVAQDVYIDMPEIDEVGNDLHDHPFTGLNYDDYYRQICYEEGAVAHIITDGMKEEAPNYAYEIDCHLHRISKATVGLYDILKDKCEYGVLGSNKASEEVIKLFPTKKQCQDVIDALVDRIEDKMGVVIEAMVYGDGCFKSPVGGIWEFADPVVSPYYTSGLKGTPNEIKIKAFADDKFKNLKGEELNNAIRDEINTHHDDSMASQGTTPRRIVDLLGSLMDLTSGSGDKGTPIVIVQNYFNKF